jgi:putative ABC transport system permease protein
MGHDIRIAVRRLLATPQFLAFAVLSLGIGVGVTTAVYSILYSLVWKPIEIADPERVVFISNPEIGQSAAPRAYLSRPDFEDLRTSSRTLSSVAASAFFYQTLVKPDSSEALEGEAVSGDYFKTVGVPAILGRTIQPRDDETAARVIALSYRLWRERFDSNPEIVGSSVRLGGQAFEVIGVVARSFDGIGRPPKRADGWIPLRTMAAFGAQGAESRERRQLAVFGRLASGRAPAVANGEIGAIGRRLDVEFPFRKSISGDAPSAPLPRSWGVSGATEVNETETRAAALILALVALVLIVACTNLASLMLARGAARERDIAVRRALGAPRLRLVRELVFEGAIIAALGGSVSLLVVRALLAVATIEIPMPGRAFVLQPELNLPALVATSVALLISLLVFGLEPALQLTRAAVTPSLLGGDGSVGVVRSGRQRALIRWQVATSATFFLVAAVLAKVVAREALHNPGIDVDRLAVATMHLPQQVWDETRARRETAALAGLLRREQGIESVALATGVPFGLSMTSWAEATTPDKPFVPRVRYELTDMIAATPEVFGTLGIPIVRGRAFDDRDDRTAPHVMIVSEKTSRTFFGTTDAIGRQLMVQPWGRPPADTFTIVGIARDTDSGFLMSRANDTTYVPLSQHYEPFVVVMARTSGDPQKAARLIQRSARQVDPDLLINSAGPASVLLAGPYFAARIATSLAAALGMLTLLLAMVGLYGVQGHLVTRRTREIGVRMAVGATRDQIQHMVLAEGFRPVMEGLVLGLVLSILARLTLRALLSASIQAIDPIGFSLVPIPLFIAASVACCVPARRAARVDPNVALRHL